MIAIYKYNKTTKETEPFTELEGPSDIAEWAQSQELLDKLNSVLVSDFSYIIPQETYNFIIL